MSLRFAWREPLVLRKWYECDDVLNEIHAFTAKKHLMTFL